MPKKKKERSAEEIAERKRRKAETSRIRRANETPEARERRLTRQRELRRAERCREKREYWQLQYEKSLQSGELNGWDSKQRRELWRLREEVIKASRPHTDLPHVDLLMASQSDKPRGQGRVRRTLPSDVFEVLCGLCHRLCLNIDAELANEHQRALLARTFPYQDVTLFRLCYKCRCSLSDNKVPLLSGSNPIMCVLVPGHLNLSNQESTNIPDGPLSTGSTDCVHAPTNADDVSRSFGPPAERGAEIFSCCLTRSCVHSDVTLLPVRKAVPQPVETSDVWTHCSVLVTTRSTQAKPKLRTTAVQTETPE